MKKILVVLFIFSFSLCEGQNWCWGKEGIVDLKSANVTSYVATNRYGNAYLTGAFSMYMIFGNDTLMPIVGCTSMYLAKFAPNGTVLWARCPISISSTSLRSCGNAVLTDANDYSYVTGSSMYDTLVFGNDTLSKGGFFVKYSPNGQLLWAKSYCGIAMCFDKHGNICMATRDSIMKFTQSGNLLVKKSVPYTNYYSITSDDSLNIFAISRKDSSNGSYNSRIPLCIKYDSNISLLWVRRPTIPNIYGGGQSTSVITDNKNNSYFTGYFWDSLNFAGHLLSCDVPKSIHSPDRHMCSIYLVKYSAGGQFLWVKQSTDAHAWKGTSLAKDNSNQIYLGGWGINADSLDFDGTLLTMVSNTGHDASFIMKLDTNGLVERGSLLRNGTIADFDLNIAINGQLVNEIAVDSAGIYDYLIGLFQQDTIICNNDTMVSSIGGQDCYISRWTTGECTVDNATETIKNTAPSITLFPDPNTGRFTISFAGTLNFMSSTIEIYNVLGEKVYSQSNIQNPTFKIDLLNQPNGVYLYRIISQNGDLIGEGKLIIAK
ncbi:MAG TPA: T9SS type A sorting domain-containing protein [Bacteroidia bacterium]|nr:T9SS type A sorting domain-containing protein [Bacteroidia bacterium]